MKMAPLSFTHWVLLFSILSCSTERLTLKRYGLHPAQIEVKGNEAYVDGTLGKLFYKKFKKTLDQYPQLTTVILLDIPGSVNDEWNVKTGKLLCKKGLKTMLTPNSIVTSGGTNLFVSGKTLAIAPGAKIGVHAWSEETKTALSFPKNHQAHQIFLDFYRAVEIDTSFYWFTLKAAPAEKMYFMSTTEIEQFLSHKISTN